MWVTGVGGRKGCRKVRYRCGWEAWMAGVRVSGVGDEWVTGDKHELQVRVRVFSKCF